VAVISEAAWLHCIVALLDYNTMTTKSCYVNVTGPEVLGNVAQWFHLFRLASAVTTFLVS